MAGKFLLSTAFFPPIQYLSLITRADNVFFETEENYLKQTFRNRCLILTANGPSPMIVPVLMGRGIKTRVKDIRIDYSKRWQQIHIRALISSYKSSAYFEYYFENIEKVITGKPEFLLDLNSKSLETVMKITGISANIVYTRDFEPVSGKDYDFRYRISPKKEEPGIYTVKEYYQVFSKKFGFVPGLSILDLIFNTGPDSINYLSGIL
jgi:hypothetical protein